MLLAFSLLLVACKDGKEKEPKPTIDQNKITEVQDFIDTIPAVDNITLDDEAFIQNVRTLYDALSDEEKALVTNYSVLENAESRIQQIKDENAALQAFNQEAVRYAKQELDKIIPQTVTDDIELPVTYTYQDQKVRYGWTSSHPNVLSIGGKVHRGYEDVTVTLTIRVTFANITDVVTKQVLVPKIELKDISKSKPVFAYLQNATYKSFTETELKTIDVINFCFASIDPDTFAIDMSSLTKLQEVTEVRNKGIRVVVSFGGYGAAGKPYSNAASTENGRKTFAANVVKMLEEYGVDGIDLDWEYPGYNTGRDTSVDRPNYTLLVQELYRQVKAANPNYLITAAVPGGPWSPDRYELDKLNNYLDYFHLMTYDLDSKEVLTFHTALFASEYTVGQCTCDESVKIYEDRGVDSKKLVLGAAFYGRIYGASGFSPKQGASEAGKTILYTNIKNEYLSRLGQGVTRYWDDKAKAPYLYDDVNHKFISYDDEESIRQKCQYVIANQLGGLMFWELGEDQTHTLIEAVYEGTLNF